jgi:hypothetical protein
MEWTMRFSGIIVTSVVLTAAVTFATDVLGQAQQTFARPTINGIRVDWCRVWGAECGQPAADEFCRRNGFHRATGFSMLEDVPPTVVITSGQRCDAPQCDALNNVTCIREARRFQRPTVQGVRVDWCLVWGNECGKPAADAFCRSRGFARATNFEKIEDVPPTIVIGSNQRCNDAFCDAIGNVTCVP